MATQRIRIKLKSFDHNLIDKSTERIVRNGKTNRSGGIGTDTTANPALSLHSKPLAARGQEIT